MRGRLHRRWHRRHGDIGAGLLDGFDGGEVYAAGHGERNAGFFSGAEQAVQVVAGLGLFIQAGVDLDELRTQGADFLGAGDLVRDADEVNDDALVVGLGCLDGTGDGGVIGAPSTVTRSAPALKAISASSSPASMVFRSAKTILSGWAFLMAVMTERPRLHQRGAEFDDVHVFGDLAGEFEGGFGGQQVDSDLEFH